MTEVVIKTDPMADFQNKLKEKVRADIASLLPEDAISALVQKAIHDEFFKRETYNEGSEYHRKMVERPSAFVLEVVKAAKPIMDAEISKAVETCRPIIEQEMARFVSEQNLALLISASIGQAMQQNTFQIAQEFIQQMKRGY